VKVFFKEFVYQQCSKNIFEFSQSVSQSVSQSDNFNFATCKLTDCLEYPLLIFISFLPTRRLGQKMHLLELSLKAMQSVLHVSVDCGLEKLRSADRLASSGVAGVALFVFKFNESICLITDRKFLTSPQIAGPLSFLY
jgi:hypothetical protein